MEDGFTIANTGPTRNRRMGSVAHLYVCPCIGVCVGVVLLFTRYSPSLRFSIKALFPPGVGRHSPLLDQQDGHQHQQNKDQDASADPGDLHHPIRLFRGVRNDFWLLRGPWNNWNATKTTSTGRIEHIGALIDYLVASGRCMWSHHIRSCYINTTISGAL